VAAEALAIFGISGRMGQALLRALREDARFRLCAALASAHSSRLGQDAAAEGRPSGIVIGADPVAALRHAVVALDFSVGSAVAAHAQACAHARVPLLVGATGLDASTRAQLERAAHEIAVLIAPNTSVAVGVLGTLAAVAAAGLGPTYDVEIFEAHHRSKRDAPSGTALSLGEMIAGVRGQHLSDVAAYDRHGVNAARVPGSIGFSVLRAGDIVGEHTVTFAAEGERLEITHRATDRVSFARGALKAAAWLLTQPAGLYGMADVLGLEKKHGQ
jgi:4-hydroxy-tetrahydrodipicolinate reductase